MKTYTICGSMRFGQEMREIAFRLETQHGFNVLQCVYNDRCSPMTKEAVENLTKAHYKKIEISDGIYVVNIGGYIGESVQAEIAYAKKLGKEILYHC